LEAFSRLRVILSVLAGKLMTNGFVYGEFFHLDVYLRKIRNIMKNFANFALVALVLSGVVKYILGKWGQDIKKIITNTLIAGVLIQASWFLMGALIDISTISTLAVGSFSSSFLESNDAIKNSINASIQEIGTKGIRFTSSGTIEHYPTTLPTSNWLENVLPNQDSISGPFIYLGMAIFKFQNFLKPTSSLVSSTGAVELTLTFAIRFLLLFFFTVGLLLLFVANIMRVGLLWLFIIWSPFLVLAIIFKPSSWWSSSIVKLFSLSNLLAAVFKPVIFVGFMSLLLMLVTSIENIMTNSAAELNNIGGILFATNNTGSSMSVENISTITISQNDLIPSTGSDATTYGKNLFATLMQLFLMLALMRWMIKLSLTIGGWAIEESMKKLVAQAESMAKSLPILPMGWGTSFNARKMMGNEQKNQLFKWFKMNKEGKFTEAERNFERKVDKWMGIKTTNFTSDDYEELTREVGNKGDFFGKTQYLAKNLDAFTISNNTQRQSLLVQYIQNNNNSSFTLDPAKTKPTFEDYFKDNEANRRQLHQQLSGKIDNSATPDYNTLIATPYYSSK